MTNPGEKDQLARNPTGRRVLMILGAIAMLAAAGIIVAPRFLSQSNVGKPLPQVQLNASVSCGDAEIQVTNNDTAGWTLARIEINGQYVRMVPAIPRGETVTLAAAQFMDPNGKRLDLPSTKCQSADVQAFMHGAEGKFNQSWPR